MKETLHYTTPIVSDLELQSNGAIIHLDSKQILKHHAVIWSGIAEFRTLYTPTKNTLFTANPEVSRKIEQMESSITARNGELLAVMSVTAKESLTEEDRQFLKEVIDFKFRVRWNEQFALYPLSVPQGKLTPYVECDRLTMMTDQTFSLPAPPSFRTKILTFTSPIELYLDDGERDYWSIDEMPMVSDWEALEYKQYILRAIAESHLPKEQGKGLALYLDEPYLQKKIESIYPTVVEVGGELKGGVEITLRHNLSDGELREVLDFCSGQFSDGWGESFEQQDIKVPDGNLLVYFYPNNCSFDTEKIFEPLIETIENLQSVAERKAKAYETGHSYNNMTLAVNIRGADIRLGLPMNEYQLQHELLLHDILWDENLEVTPFWSSYIEKDMLPKSATFLESNTLAHRLAGLYHEEMGDQYSIVFESILALDKRDGHEVFKTFRDMTALTYHLDSAQFVSFDSYQELGEFFIDYSFTKEFANLTDGQLKYLDLEAYGKERAKTGYVYDKIYYVEPNESIWNILEKNQNISSTYLPKPTAQFEAKLLTNAGGELWIKFPAPNLEMTSYEVIDFKGPSFLLPYIRPDTTLQELQNTSLLLELLDSHQTHLLQAITELSLSDNLADYLQEVSYYLDHSAYYPKETMIKMVLSSSGIDPNGRGIEFVNVEKLMDSYMNTAPYIAAYDGYLELPELESILEIDQQDSQDFTMTL